MDLPIWENLEALLFARGNEAGMNTNPSIVIIGGGFGGLAATKALRRTRCQITLIDRTNHYLFQPLLYQVATTVLDTSQIAYPLRGLLSNQKNTNVLLAVVTSIDRAKRVVTAVSQSRTEVKIGYDYLIVATGASYSYFGHDEFAKYAHGLKSLVDAVAIRSQILNSFEAAEISSDDVERAKLLTFVLVGAGPSGVELASAISEIINSTLNQEYRGLDKKNAHVILVDTSNRVLTSFSESISNAAAKRLKQLGVELRLGQTVDMVDEDGVMVAGERIASKTVIWTAGVTPSPAGKWLTDVKTDKAGRVLVNPNLSVPDSPEIFVIGDTASLADEGVKLPGVAQVAIQQGKYVGHVLDCLLTSKAAPGAFRYFDKGNLAVIGRGFAVLETKGIRLTGFLAWIIWAVVHIMFLATSSLRIGVFMQWVWAFFTHQGASSLIVKGVSANENGTSST